MGRKVTIPLNVNKVMGLSPALTEMLFVLVPDSMVVAVSLQCNYPPEKVSQKPVLNTYPLDIEKLISLKPDLVFTEAGISSPADVAQMEKAGISVYVFQYQKVWDIISAMDSISVWIPKNEKADFLLDSLKKETRLLEEKVAGLGEKEKPSLLAITWMDPIFAYGHNTWMTDKMRLAGGKNGIEQDLDKPYPQISREFILKMNPDVLFGGTFAKMDSTFFKLYPELKMIKAYQTKSVFSLNDDLASRPGPRFLEGIREIEQKVDQIKAR